MKQERSRMSTLSNQTGNAYAQPRIVRDLAGMLLRALGAALAASATLSVLVLLLERGA
jgi:hypothetical protein